MKLSILITRVGESDRFDLELISKTVSTGFYGQIIPVMRVKPLHAPLDAYSPLRGQYLAPKLLTLVESLRRREGFDLGFGVTLLDLYVDGLNFIFGEASDRSAMFSTNRLRAGVDAGSKLYAKRVATVARHEIGHILGLGHCYNTRCCMRFHNSVEEVDRGSGDFCPRCAEEVARTLGEAMEPMGSLSL